jgi:hypothetical protein
MHSAMVASEAGHLDFSPPGVHDLHVGDDDGLGELGPQPPYGLQALALDQRRPRLQPPHPPLPSLMGRAQRLREVGEIEGELQLRVGDLHRSVTSRWRVG